MPITKIDLLPLKPEDHYRITALATYHQSEYSIYYTAVTIIDNTAIIRVNQLMNDREIYFNTTTLKTMTIGMFSKYLPGLEIKPIPRAHSSILESASEAKVCRRKERNKLRLLRNLKNHQ